MHVFSRLEKNSADAASAKYAISCILNMYMQSRKTLFFVSIKTVVLWYEYELI